MTPTLAINGACTCEDCAALRDALAALTLPVSLVHDDGSPVVIQVADAELTAAEGYLRLALTRDDLDPTEIRRVVGRLREYGSTDTNFPHRYAEASKLVASLKLDEAPA